MTVSYDRNSFLINGQRVFLTSGSLHYFRIPRPLWRDRLEKAKAAGLNAIEFYVAWNWHESEPGQFDFSGDRDLDHFLTLAEELGFYLIARPGPYICAEWDFGGFPAWLMQTAGLQLRHYDPLYLRYVDRYFEHVLPIIVKHQVGNAEKKAAGGGVIMVQAENELGLVAADDAALYMRHLITLYRRLGVTVPINTCVGGTADTIECVNGHTPADQFAAMRRKQPDAPLFCTEFWPGWYLTWDRKTEQYPRLPAVVERETWRILAHGGAGYNYYMWHGGTNFGYNAMYLGTTSYDYTAPLSEAGGLWEKYHRCRRVALFAQTFADILTEAREGDFANIERDTTLGANFFQRVSENGKILFVENPNPARVGIYLYINGISLDLFVPAESVRPVVYDAPLGPNASLALCTAGVMARWTQDNSTLLVVQGEPGVTNRAIVAVQVPVTKEPLVTGGLVAAWREQEAPEGVENDQAETTDHVLTLADIDTLEAFLSAEERGEQVDVAELRARAMQSAPISEGGVLTFTIAFTDTPQTAEFTVDGHTYRLLALPTELADRTWWNPDEAQNAIPTLFIGAQTPALPASGLCLGLNEGETRLWRYANGTLETQPAPAQRALPEPPEIGAWVYYDGEIESTEDYDDSHALGMYAPTNRALLDAKPGYA